MHLKKARSRAKSSGVCTPPNGQMAAARPPGRASTLPATRLPWRWALCFCTLDQASPKSPQTIQPEAHRLVLNVSRSTVKYKWTTEVPCSFPSQNAAPRMSLALTQEMFE